MQWIRSFRRKRLTLLGKEFLLPRFRSARIPRLRVRRTPIQKIVRTAFACNWPESRLAKFRGDRRHSLFLLHHHSTSLLRPTRSTRISLSRWAFELDCTASMATASLNSNSSSTNPVPTQQNGAPISPSNKSRGQLKRLNKKQMGAVKQANGGASEVQDERPIEKPATTLQVSSLPLLQPFITALDEADHTNRANRTR